MNFKNEYKVDGVKIQYLAIAKNMRIPADTNVHELLQVCLSDARTSC